MKIRSAPYSLCALLLSGLCLYLIAGPISIAAHPNAAPSQQDRTPTRTATPTKPGPFVATPDGPLIFDFPTPRPVGSPGPISGLGLSALEKSALAVVKVQGCAEAGAERLRCQRRHRRHHPSAWADPDRAPRRCRGPQRSAIVAPARNQHWRGDGCGCPQRGRQPTGHRSRPSIPNWILRCFGSSSRRINRNSICPLCPWKGSAAVRFVEPPCRSWAFPREPRV